MIVYVESNFILELALLRAEHKDCEMLVSLAESQDIDLTLPAFSVGEPYEALGRRLKRREELRKKLSTEIQELARSKPYQESPTEFQRLMDLLLSSGEEEKRKLDKALNKTLSVAEVIPIDLNTIKAAIAFQESHSLSPQDSIVYASILDHLARTSGGPHCFITKNSRDFVTPDIVNDLAAYNCRLLSQFSDGLGYIRSHL